ncbi:MAG: alpha-1,2-fucosyltransferase [Pseudomonadota bacterium]
MIIVGLYGGLGNQLFQYAVARRLAHFRKVELVVDTSWYDTVHENVTPRKYEMSQYRIEARGMSTAEIFSRALFTHRILKRLPLPRRLKLVREKSFPFDPRILTLPDNVYLDGYWQSPKYFDDIRDILLEELTPLEALSEADEAVAAKIRASNAVSIHVRRGDYVSLASAAQTHGLCSLDYYKSAVSQLQRRVQAPVFFVFSDDPEWTSANLHFDSPTVYVNHNGPDKAFQDLRLMSFCQHQIIANSSFSWWGAWLNRNPGKIVIAPEKWFADRSDTQDLYPPAWEKI